MPLRRGFVLAWLNDKRLVTLDTDGGVEVLPVFTSEDSVGAAARRIPMPPDGILVRLEVWADESGGFKQAAIGGGLYDLLLDWSRLRALWDTDPGFNEEFDRCIARLTSDTRTANTDPES